MGVDVFGSGCMWFWVVLLNVVFWFVDVLGFEYVSGWGVRGNLCCGLMWWCGLVVFICFYF